MPTVFFLNLELVSYRAAYTAALHLRLLWASLLWPSFPKRLMRLPHLVAGASQRKKSQITSSFQASTQSHLLMSHQPNLESVWAMPRPTGKFHGGHWLRPPTLPDHVDRDLRVPGTVPGTQHMLQVLMLCQPEHSIFLYVFCVCENEVHSLDNMPRIPCLDNNRAMIYGWT